MRTLVFVPEQIGGNARTFFKSEIMQRLSLARSNNLGNIRPVDADDYDTSSWEDLVTTVKRYKSSFDALVLGVDDKTAEQYKNMIERSTKKIAELSGDLSVVAYIKDSTPRTQFNLLASHVLHTVDSSALDLTLAACIGRAVTAKVSTTRSVKFGPVDVDLVTGDVTLEEGSKARFTNTEARLFAYLAGNRNRVVTKQSMIDGLYGEMDEPESKIIDAYVCKIRGKLNKLNPEKYPRLGSIVETIWGKGYRLNDYDAAPKVETASRWNGADTQKAPTREARLN